MVTYEYQYEIAEDEGDYSDYSDDYDSKGAKKNSKASKNAQKRPKNTYIFKKNKNISILIIF